MAEINVDDLTREIQTLSLPNDIRLELINCLQEIITLNLDDINNITGAQISLSRCNDVIILLNKFAKAAVDALEKCELLPSPLGIICKIITEVVGSVFSKDIASVVINRFTAILDADLIAKCRASCTKISHCISYMQGLPPIDDLEQDQRMHHSQLVASDLPIQTGLDEVLFLGEKIKQMVDVADLDKANKLFEHAQLYCCLATYRELFLLYRFAIQSALSGDAGPVRNVLLAQRTNDREVLMFMYRPTTHSVRLFRRYFPSQWLILDRFLTRRGLVTDDLSELSGSTFKVTSVRFNTKSLCPSRFLQQETFLRLSNSDGKAAYLEFRAVANNHNVFTLWSHCYQPPRQIYCDQLHAMSISEGVPPVAKSMWYVLRVQPQRPRETMCYYMIWLATDHQLCLSTYWNGNARLTSCSKPDHSFFWLLEKGQVQRATTKRVLYQRSKGPNVKKSKTGGNGT